MLQHSVNFQEKLEFENNLRNTFWCKWIPGPGHYCHDLAVMRWNWYCESVSEREKVFLEFSENQHTLW